MATCHVPSASTYNLYPINVGLIRLDGGFPIQTMWFMFPSRWTNCYILPSCKPIFSARMKSIWALGCLLSCFLESRGLNGRTLRNQLWLLVWLGENEAPSAGKCGRGKSPWCVVSDLVLILMLCSLSMWCFPKHHTLPASFSSPVKVGINFYLPSAGNTKWETVYGPQLPAGIQCYPETFIVNTLMHFISILLPWQFFYIIVIIWYV